MKRIFLWLIRWYQRNISSRTPATCRFYPTCSAYTYQAIDRFGCAKGCLLGAWRIMRCCPLFPGGYDPVPEKKGKKGKGTDCADHCRCGEQEGHAAADVCENDRPGAAGGERNKEESKKM